MPEPVPTPRAAGGLRSSAIIGVAVAAGLLLAVLAGLIVWASVESDVVAGFGWLLSERWGVATLVDVYGGAFVVAVWMRVTTRSTAAWLGWVSALFALGHVVSLSYLLWRLWKARTLAEAVVGAPAAA
jgi:hypothetical protein